MDYQLIFTQKAKMENLLLPEKDMQKYIMDYIELSSLHLKHLNCFLYREMAINTVLRGEEFIQVLQTLLKYGKDTSCYYIDSGRFVRKGTLEAHEIEHQFMDFTGVLYMNYK